MSTSPDSFYIPMFTKSELDAQGISVADCKEIEVKGVLMYLLKTDVEQERQWRMARKESS